MLFVVLACWNTLPFHWSWWHYWTLQWITQGRVYSQCESSGLRRRVVWWWVQNCMVS